MEDKETVCAVVVTYNRKKLLLECLKGLIRQTKPLDAIYIVDNASTDGTPELLHKSNYVGELPPAHLNSKFETNFQVELNGEEIKIHYVRLDQNTGGAGGFYEGVKSAYEKGYDWLWLMDDDCEPEINALEELIKYFDEKNVSALVSTIKDENNLIQTAFRGKFNFNKGIPVQIPLPIEEYKFNFVEIDMSGFNGILINQKAINKIGFPKKEFFIHADDLEYCIRLRKTGKIFLITNSSITHKNARTKSSNQKKFFRTDINIHPYETHWINYFYFRNLIWLGTKYANNKPSFYFDILKKYFLYSGFIILFNDHKMKRIHLLTSSFLDGLKGNFDNKKPKMILYGNNE